MLEQIIKTSAAVLFGAGAGYYGAVPLQRFIVRFMANKPDGAMISVLATFIILACFGYLSGAIIDVLPTQVAVIILCCMLGYLGVRTPSIIKRRSLRIDPR